MKRVVVCMVFAVLCAASLAAQNYTDGFYFAQDANYANNQKNQVVIEVKGGKIVSADWNILSLSAGAKDIKSNINDGTANATAINWTVQAAAAEAHLISNQNASASSVPGLSASAVKPFFDLAKKALGDKAVAKGAFKKDGWFYAEASNPDGFHTKNTALVTVVNGTIVDALWNGILVGMPASVNPSKMITSMAKRYPMTGAKKLWHEQATATAAALLKTGDPNGLKVKADGHADGISGVSILIKEYRDVANQALQSAR